MKKEIRSKENLKITKVANETKIKTSIEHLKTYNQKILKEKIYLMTPENTPLDFYIITKNSCNLGYVKLEKDDLESYEIKQNELLGYLVDEEEFEKAKSR